jgi:voltage-gated potassium channel
MQGLVYVSLSAGDPGSAFTEPLDKIDGLYFAVTVMTTVGFGDITAATGLTRGFVTFQMLVNLVLLGTAVRVLTSSIRHVLASRTEGAPTGDPASGGGDPASAGPRHAGPDGA